MTMTSGKGQDNATLLDVLVDGFEKNETLCSYHWRELPMPDEEAATQRFAALCEEARRWKGPPLRTEETWKRKLVAWEDLEIRQAGRGIMVRIKAPQFDKWWHASTTWQGDPMRDIWQWLKEEQ